MRQTLRIMIQVIPTLSIPLYIMTMYSPILNWNTTCCITSGIVLDENCTVFRKNNNR